jgi:hypothetical protein
MHQRIFPSMQGNDASIYMFPRPRRENVNNISTRLRRVERNASLYISPPEGGT